MLTIKVPNADTNIGFCTICPKEVLQKAYKDKVGSTIDFLGAKMKVVEVRITEESIEMDLEEAK